MNNGMLLETVEALEESPLWRRKTEIWEVLQCEKEQVVQALVDGGPLLPAQVVAGVQERDPSEEWGTDIEWRRRGQLEERLREITEAQDRLFDGDYGLCVECGKQIEPKRLSADPAVAMCLMCQRQVEPVITYHTL